MSEQNPMPFHVEKRASGIAIISTNDDPLNRMTLAYIDQLVDAIEDIAQDNSIRAFVLTADGLSNFSVGMDLKQLQGGVSARGGLDAFFDPSAST